MVGNKGTLFALDATGQVRFANIPTKSNLTVIGYANGRFTALSSGFDYSANQPDSATWTSTNGIDWSRASNSSTSMLVGSHYGHRKVAYGNGL